MAYQLWLNRIEDVITYKRNQEGKYYKPGMQCLPLIFKVNGIKKDKFSIKEIDSLICGFKDEKEFIEKLKSYGNNYINDNRVEKLLLTSNHNGYLHEKRILFNDKFLQKCAINNRKDKKIGYTEEVKQFISYIKNIALNDVTSNYLLNPSKVDCLTLEEKSKLKNIFPQNVKKSGQIISLLKNYKNYMSNYNFQYKNNLSTTEIEQELIYNDKEIKNYFLDNYQNLRKIVEWEHMYKEILMKKMKQTSSKFEQISFMSQIEQVNIYQDYRNGISDKRKQVFLLSVDDAKAIYEPKKNTRDIKNEKLRELYSAGGLENVMENMSIDEIYSNLSDAEIIGLIPGKK